MATDPRTDLLGRVVDYLRNHGLADRSLRQIASAVGTSHRMLVYHFGSRDGLLAAVVGAVEDDERARAAGVGAVDAEHVLEREWATMSAPERFDEERLFFELTARAMHGAPGTESLAHSTVRGWLDVGVPIAGRLGADEATARVLTRLDTAVLRGLLHDLLVTGDRPETQVAFELYADWRRSALAAMAERAG